MDPVMYILVNSDLNMGKGKIAAQVGHVVQAIVEELCTKNNSTYREWKNSGSAKIVLKASRDEIEKHISLPNARHVIDEGRTQIPAGSLTVLGFLPSRDMADILAKYKLL